MSAYSNIGVLLKYCSYLALLPFYKEKSREFFGYRFHSVVLISITCGVYAFSIIAGLKYGGFITVINILLSGIWSLAYSVGFWGSSTFNLPKFQRLFNTFNAIDGHLLTVQKVKSRSIKYVYVKVYFSNILMICFIVYDFYHYCTFGGDNDVLSLYPYEVERYFIYLEDILQYFILESIRQRFSMFNSAVENMTVSVMKITLGRVENKLKNLVVIHRNICNTLIVFNDIFSWRLFSMVFYVFMGLLKNIYYILQAESSELSTVVNIYVSQIPAVVQIVMLTIKCEQILAEEEIAKTVSNELLIKNLEGSQYYSSEEYLLLFQQTTTVTPTITAGGFFQVNYAMLFMLVNLIATYIIIMIQLIKS